MIRHFQPNLDDEAPLFVYPNYTTAISPSRTPPPQSVISTRTRTRTGSVSTSSATRAQPGYPGSGPTHTPYSTSSGSSSGRGAPGIPQRPPHARKRDLVPGVDYFKIGELVDIRRYNSEKKAFSEWFPGRIIRPIFYPRDNSSPRVQQCREYVVEFTCPYSQTPKEMIFSPDHGEIREIPSDIPADIPAHPTPGKVVVFALLATPYRGTDGKQYLYKAWTPAYLLTHMNPRGVTVRALLGPGKGKDYADVQETKTYSKHVAADLMKRGQVVEGDGTQRY
ncbi:hypothetical protein BDQ12DRAFT_666480 [Crucibulum laeve]|uniref:Uncharacterized protein n=1 Tax=Crucibulum laeve TaxID=68775 RepID=A0A5C3MAV6_9AGAR|nr:hypothetical protein BDQ12DRAFT_666480 [Crucibulum laeve]